MTARLTRFILPLAFLLLLLAAPDLLAAEAGEEAEIMPDMADPATYYEAVWSIVVFGIFFAVLSFVVWPKILKALREREEKQQQDLQSAEQARTEAKQTLEQYQQQLAEARQEARQVLDEARKDAEQMRSKMLADAEREMNQLRQRATDDIELAKRQAVQELHTTSAELATQVAEKILQRQINEEDTQRLVEQSLEELNRTGRN